MCIEKIELFGRAFPSHGRGRRFNPYSAHQLSNWLRSNLSLPENPVSAVPGRTSRKHASRTGVKPGGFVRDLACPRPAPLKQTGFAAKSNPSGARVGKRADYGRSHDRPPTLPVRSSARRNPKRRKSPRLAPRAFLFHVGAAPASQRRLSVRLRATRGSSCPARPPPRSTPLRARTQTVRRWRPAEFAPTAKIQTFRWEKPTLASAFPAAMPRALGLSLTTNPRKKHDYPPAFYCRRKWHRH
jgi:hypothetical protein